MPRLLPNTHAYLPPRAKQFCDLAPKVHWLESYAQMGNLEYILEKVGKHFCEPEPLDKAFPQLLRDYSLLDAGFSKTFPQIIKFADNQWLELIP